MEDSSPLTSASISNKIIRFGYKTEGTLHKINTTANPFPVDTIFIFRNIVEWNF